MDNSQRSSGNKVALMISGSIVVASIIVVIVILSFFKLYDPNDYGRSNGGIDANNTGIPEEAHIQKEKITN